MFEWYDNQMQPSSNFRKLLQERIEKTNPRRKLTTEENKRFNKSEFIAYKLKRGENMHILQLQIWSNENEYAKIDVALQKHLWLSRVLID